MSPWKAEIIKDVLKFSNRWDLDSLELVNQEFAQVIVLDFSLEPYRLLRKLIIRLINQSKKCPRAKFPCTVLYEHQIKDVSFEQVLKVFGNPNIRFASTYIAVDADYLDMEPFFEISHILKHLWEGKDLVIDMDPQRSFEQLHFFGALFNDGITTGAGNLAIIDRSYKYNRASEFSPFMCADTSRRRQITIASVLTAELAATLLDWLHEEGTCKELTWVFLTDESKVASEQVKIVMELIQELQTKFSTSEKPAPYKFWMINLFRKTFWYHNSFPLDSFNKTTDEMLTFRKGVFGSKRYRSGVEESGFSSGLSDVKIERALIDDVSSCSSMISLESDCVCSSSEIESEDEMSDVNWNDV
ncbi:hypothetical protein DdX_16996 [Ditylenchus destructor]|uniref:Uncharacterized protein n=1 Tax=Ditylenchus destructor TaxID=166010 RepID=A0AAD4QZE3_9BILA|nr:hypothetical protein DdX_16996 [Ditylenchus destructor]